MPSPLKHQQLKLTQPKKPNLFAQAESEADKTKLIGRPDRGYDYITSGKRRLERIMRTLPLITEDGELN